MIAFLLAQMIAMTGARVVPAAGPKLENATVLIRDGRIAAVGTTVAVPQGATRIDASGKWVTPGLVDGAGQMGLREISAVQNTNEGQVQGNDVAASFNVLEGINPGSSLIRVTRIEGVTTTLATPGGALIWGQAALIDLDGATIEAMQVKAPAAMVVDLSEGSKSAGGGSRAGVAQRLRRVFNDALEYARRRNDYSRAQMQQLSASAADLMETATENTRDLRQQAGNAVANGMTWDQALRAVTLTPAEIFGVADRYGSLEAGRVANVVVWSGDPFEFSTGVEHVYIRGREIPLRSRQTELLERYRTLPPKY